MQSDKMHLHPTRRLLVRSKQVSLVEELSEATVAGAWRRGVPCGLAGTFWWPWCLPCVTGSVCACVCVSSDIHRARDALVKCPVGQLHTQPSWPGPGWLAL